MNKLNNKGYITVEVLIASIVAAIIAVFLIEITVKLAGRTDDAYVDTVLNTDKSLTIKNIKKFIEEDIRKCDGINETIIGIDEPGKREWKFYFNNNSECEYATLFVEVVKKEKKDVMQISYFDNQHNEIYKKEIDNIVSFVSKVNSTNKYVLINITGDNIFSDKDLNISIPIQNKKVYNVKIKFIDNIIIEGNVNPSGIFKGETSVLNDIYTNASVISVTCSPEKKDEDIIISNVFGKFVFEIKNVNSDLECDIKSKGGT